MRRRAPRPLALSVERLRVELAPASDLARVQAIWEDAVGAAVAAEAMPASLLDGTLTVDCGSSVWAAELTMMAAELCERVNAALGGAPAGRERPLVERLRCRTR